MPPTEDRALVNAALDSLQPGEGTAIGDAVALLSASGSATARSEQAVPRSILLISDGAQDGGRIQPAAAIEEAKERDVPVYTVLVGTPEGAVEEELPGGFRRIIQVPPSPETLEQLAAGTGGEYFAAVDAEQLRAVYEQLGSRLGQKEEVREITDVFSAGAAAFLLIGGALSAFLFRRVADAGRPVRRGARDPGGRPRRRSPAGRHERVRRAHGLRADRRPMGGRPDEHDRPAARGPVPAHLSRAATSRPGSTPSSPGARSTSASSAGSEAP